MPSAWASRRPAGGEGSFSSSRRWQTVEQARWAIDESMRMGGEGSIDSRGSARADMHTCCRRRRRRRRPHRDNRRGEGRRAPPLLRPFGTYNLYHETHLRSRLLESLWLPVDRWRLPSPPRQVSIAVAPASPFPVCVGCRAGQDEATNHSIGRFRLTAPPHPSVPSTMHQPIDHAPVGARRFPADPAGLDSLCPWGHQRR